MKHRFWAILLGLFLLNTSIAQEKTDISWSGFVSAESFYDTRQTFDTCEGDIWLFSKPLRMYDFGRDINARAAFNMLALHSRLRGTIKELKVNNAKINRAIEFDFAGTADSYINLIRMRHAYVKPNRNKMYAF